MELGLSSRRPSLQRPAFTRTTPALLPYNARAVAVIKAGKALARKAIPAVEEADAASFREHADQVAALVRGSTPSGSR